MRFNTILAAGLLAIAACSGPGGEVTEFDEIPVGVSVSIESGNVTVEGNANVSGASVEIEASGDVESTVEIVNGVLGITDTCDGSDCATDYSILVETDVVVNVTVSSGNVTVANLEGDLNLAIGTGDVTIATVNGQFQVVVGDGTIIGTRLESPSATFDVEKGNVDVTFDEVVSQLLVATGEGDVTVQLPDGEYAFVTSPETDGVDILLDNTQGAANEIALETGDGEIKVYRR